MLSRPRPTRPRRADDTRLFSSTTTQASTAPSRESSKMSIALISASTTNGASSSRQSAEARSVAPKMPHLASTERAPQITSQMKSKLAAARSEQMALAAKGTAKAIPIPKKSSKRRLSPPSEGSMSLSSDGSAVTATPRVDLQDWPLPNSLRYSVMRSSGSMQKSHPSHKQMTVTEPNNEEDDASVVIPNSNGAAWEAIMEEIDSDSDADSFTFASEPDVSEHGSIQIGLASSEQPAQRNGGALRPPPLKMTRNKPAAESTIVPLPGAPMAVQKGGAPDTVSRCASLEALSHSHEAGLLFQSPRVDRKVRFTEPDPHHHVTGQPARIPKVPSKDEYKALVARGMREFQEYATNQDQNSTTKPPVPDKSPAPKKSSTSQKSQPPRRSQSSPEPRQTQTSSKSPKAQPPLRSQLSLRAQLFSKSRSSARRHVVKQPVIVKDAGLKQSMRGALGALKKRTSKALSLDMAPGPKRRSLAVLMQPQNVRQSVEDISAQVATGRGKPPKRESRRESRSRLQKSQKTGGGGSSSPRASRFFKRSSGAMMSGAVGSSARNRNASRSTRAELEVQGPYYELAADDADGNIRRDGSLSPIRVWNDGGAFWLAANKRMNETSSTLALVHGVGVDHYGSRRRDWAEEYRSAIAF